MPVSSHLPVNDVTVTPPKPVLRLERSTHAVQTVTAKDLEPVQKLSLCADAKESRISLFWPVSCSRESASDFPNILGPSRAWALCDMLAASGEKAAPRRAPSRIPSGKKNGVRLANGVRLTLRHGISSTRHRHSLFALCDVRAAFPHLSVQAARRGQILLDALLLGSTESIYKSAR